jgi:hypothetical protein
MDSGAGKVSSFRFGPDNNIYRKKFSKIYGIFTLKNLTEFSLKLFWCNFVPRSKFWLLLLDGGLTELF